MSLLTKIAGSQNSNQSMQMDYLSGVLMILRSGSSMETSNFPQRHFKWQWPV